MIAIWGCSGDETSTPVSPDTTAPTVVSTSPADGAVGVPVDASISITFDEEMNRFTFTRNTFAVSDGVNGIILYGNKTAVFSPDENLLYDWTYTAVVTTDVADEAGVEGKDAVLLLALAAVSLEHPAVDHDTRATVNTEQMT